MNQLDSLIDLLSRLPSIGKKSAARIAYWLLRSDSDYNKILGKKISIIQDIIHPCPVCGNLTEKSECEICTDTSRENDIMCVVEQPQDIMNIESIGEYNGFYHVLNGVLAPLDGIGPEELRLSDFINRIKRLGTSEIIIATNPTLEGDSTAMYIQHMCRDMDIKVTRIATGLPVGGDMEYADKLSLSRSFKDRRKL